MCTLRIDHFISKRAPDKGIPSCLDKFIIRGYLVDYTSACFV